MPSVVASFFLQAADVEKTKPTTTDRKINFLNMNVSFLENSPITWGINIVGLKPKKNKKPFNVL